MYLRVLIELVLSKSNIRVQLEFSFLFILVFFLIFNFESTKELEFNYESFSLGVKFLFFPT